jgi:hypothetical protein
VRMLAFGSATDDVCALVFGAAEGFVPNDRCLQWVRVMAVPQRMAGANISVLPIDGGGVDKGVSELPTMDVWRWCVDDVRALRCSIAMRQ